MGRTGCRRQNNCRSRIGSSTAPWRSSSSTSWPTPWPGFARWRGDEDVLAVDVEHPSFEEWWEPFTLGVGLPGAT